MTRDSGAPALRVVIVGTGAVSAHGDSVDTLWAGVEAGRVAIHPLRRLATEGFRSHIGGEAPYPLAVGHDYAGHGGHRDPLIDFALHAAEEAMQRAGLGFDMVPAERWGLVLGNSMGAFSSLRSWYIANVLGDSSDAGALRMAPPQLMVETIGASLGLGGPLLSVTNSCAAGATAIGLAIDLIRSEQADVALAGGAESLTDLVYAAFDCIQALSPEPARPYAAGRTGLSLGEGCGLLLLVREDIAVARRLAIMGEVIGYGLSADGYDATAPEPTGAGMARAMCAAMSHAGIVPEDVDYVNGHGTGTAKNDPAETRAIRLALGTRADFVPVSSTKSLIGHLLGGAGGIEAVVTVRALQEGIAPPTAGYDTEDPECDLDYVPQVSRAVSMDVALSNNFAFGGANATLAFSHHLPERVGKAATKERVVVTGMGMETPDGKELSTLSRAWKAGRQDDSSVRRIQLDTAPFLTPRDCRRMDRLGILSVLVAARALKHAGIAISAENRERVGVAYGTGLGPMESTELFWRPLYQEGPAAANPALSPNLVHNAAPGQVSIRTGAVGPTLTLTGGHAAGAMALCAGTMLLREARADAMICLAADTVTETVVQAYQELGLLSSDSVYQISESGAALVLETMSSAQTRGASIRGEVLGFGIASDLAAPDYPNSRQTGLERAVYLALRSAALQPCEIGAVWGSSPGIQALDTAEQSVLERVFPAGIEIHTPKTAIGDTIGAGGSLSLALALSHASSDAAQTRKPVLITSCSMGRTSVALIVAPPALS